MAEIRFDPQEVSDAYHILRWAAEELDGRARDLDADLGDAPTPPSREDREDLRELRRKGRAARRLAAKFVRER